MFNCHAEFVGAVVSLAVNVLFESEYFVLVQHDVNLVDCLLVSRSLLVRLLHSPLSSQLACLHRVLSRIS